MFSSKVASKVLAGLAASVLLSATANAQWVLTGGNLLNTGPQNVGINVGPLGGPPFTPVCDPLHIGNQGGVTPIIRLSGGGAMPPGAVCGAGAFCAFSQLGFEAAAGGVIAPPVSTGGDVVLATQGCAQDVVLAANGILTGDIRFATKTAANVLVERMTVTDNQGFVGIGTVAPVNRLDVRGNMAVGTLYAGVSAAPANGMIVQGRVGIGMTSPTYQLDVTGDIRTSATLHLGGQIEDATGNFGTAGDVLTVNTGGDAVWQAPTGGGWALGGNGVAAATDLGTTTGFDLPIITSGTEKMRVTVGGDVGIGMVAPLYMLDVAGDVRSGGILHVSNQLEDAVGAVGVPGQVLTVNGAGNVQWQPAGAGAGWALGGNPVPALPAVATTIGTTTNQHLPIITNNIERMRVTNAGQVGIGVVAPAALLHVGGTARIDNSLITGAVPTAGAAGDLLVSQGAGAAAEWTPAATVLASSAWGLSGNAASATDVLGTTNANDLNIVTGTGGPNVRMTFSGAGPYIGVGTTPNATDILNVAGTVTIAGNVGISAANLTVGGGVTCNTLTVLSDARLKRNVEPISGALSKVMALRGVTYNFDRAVDPKMVLPAERQIGYIAQELEQVVPEVVANSTDGYKRVSYHMLVPVLTSAIQEQERTIQSQQAQIDALTARLTQLEQQLGPAGKVPQKTEGGAGLRAR